MSEHKFSCMECKVRACEEGDEQRYPKFCLTKQMSEKEISDIKNVYTDQDPLGTKLTKASSEVEGIFYGQLTRVEEIVRFAQRIGAKKIGIASCVGLVEEAQAFCKVLKANDLDYYGAICKVGAIDKTEIGIDEEVKICPGTHESMCNPILQAQMLNDENTDLNVVVGLCVGHDSVFMKNSNAPVTTLITKDRVTGHNPAAPLYTLNKYYEKLLK